MRDIKFRAWDKKNKKMINVNILHFGQKQLNSFDEEWGKWHNYSKRGDCILIQYLGFTDRNGKDIYEGDIIKVYDWGVNTKNKVLHTTPIIWSDELFGYDYELSFDIDRYDMFRNIEVIGNKYENLEHYSYN